MKQRKMIGILAGMGPRSTAPFLELVIDQCQQQYGAKHDIDFPHMMIYSLPTPFYLDRPLDHEHLRDSVCAGLKKLESAGVDFIVIPCNTVHAYFEDLKSSIRIPLLNIVDETLGEIKGERNHVALFATPSTVQSQIFQNGIKAAHHTLLDPSITQQRVTELIGMVKAKADANRLQEKWKELIDLTVSHNVDTAIVACTDLAELARQATPVSILDSSLCLAKAAVRTYLESSVLS